jgi:methyl-accepting chemotaxis protein
MATAIHNGINKPENCAYYTLALLKEKTNTEELNRQLQINISQASNLIDGINELVQNLNATIGSQAAAVDHSSTKTEEIITSIKTTSEFSLKQQESVKELIEIAGQGQESMKKTIQSIQEISQSVEGISSAIQIIASIAANTNLLSMNAAIEAAHAGDAGMGFAVVAGEIRRLSETTRENSVSISHTLKNIIDGIAGTSKQSSETDNRIIQMSREINGFAKTMSAFIDTFKELSAKSVDITASLVSLKEQSSAVKQSYAQMFEMTEKLAGAMRDLSALSKQ